MLCSQAVHGSLTASSSVQMGKGLPFHILLSHGLIITYPLAGGYVLFYTAFLTALSLSLFLSFFRKFPFGITRPLLERE